MSAQAVRFPHGRARNLLSAMSRLCALLVHLQRWSSAPRRRCQETCARHANRDAAGVPTVWLQEYVQDLRPAHAKGTDRARQGRHTWTRRPARLDDRRAYPAGQREGLGPEVSSRVVVVFLAAKLSQTRFALWPVRDVGSSLDVLRQLRTNYGRYWMVELVTLIGVSSCWEICGYFGYQDPPMLLMMTELSILMSPE
jgi:hypothetical protein